MNDKKKLKKKKVTNAIDSELAKEFKVFSAFHERKMSEILEEAMRDIMEKYGWEKRK